MATNSKPKTFPKEVNFSELNDEPMDLSYVAPSYKDYRDGMDIFRGGTGQFNQFNYNKHCWHMIGDQMNQHEACCWCATKKLEYKHQEGHGKALGELKRQIDHSNDTCDAPRNTVDVWINQVKSKPVYRFNDDPSNSTPTSKVQFSDQTANPSLN